MKSPSWWLAGATGLTLALQLSGLWLKAAHTPTTAIEVAQGFLHRLQARQFAQAFELTVKQGHVGRTPDELEQNSRRALCKADHLVSTFPQQSNGNRLRRLISGRDIEMAQVQVEFSGACLLRVTLHRSTDNTWRVHRFASHAG